MNSLRLAFAGDYEVSHNSTAFLRAFRIINNIQDYKSDFIYALSLSENSENDKNNIWKMFENTCIELEKADAKFIIARFMYFVFKNKTYFDIENKFKSHLDNVDDSLYDFCVDCYKKYCNNDSKYTFCEYYTVYTSEIDTLDNSESASNKKAGYLMPFYFTAESKNDIKSCDTLIKAIIQDLNEVEWDKLKTSDPDGHVLANLAILANYCDFFASEFFKRLYKYKNKSYYENNINDGSFFRENEFGALEEMAEGLTALIEKIDSSYFSHFGYRNVSAFISYCTALLVSKANNDRVLKQKAINFLIKYFVYILPEDINPLLLYTLCYCTLNSEDLSQANYLYSRYHYLTTCDDSKPLYNQLEKMVNYIRKWTDIINGDGLIYNGLTKEKALITHSTKQLGILNEAITRGNVVSFLDDMLEYIKSKKTPSKKEYNRLVELIEAFSDIPGSIRLDLIDPDFNRNAYKDDKVETIHSKKLIDEGQILYRSNYKLDLCYLQEELLDIWKANDMLCCDHIYDLSKKQIKEGIKKICNKRKEESLPDEQKISDMYEIIDSIILKLSYANLDSARQKARGSRNKFINSISEDNRAELGWLKYVFSNNYSPNEQIKELTTKIENYITTAEFVYQSLNEEDAPDKLDYSPAVLPLTKTLELLVNYIYQGIKDGNSEIFEKLDPDKKFYYCKDKLKKDIELGPGIHLFCAEYLDEKHLAEYLKKYIDLSNILINEKTNQGKQEYKFFKKLDQVRSKYRNNLAHDRSFGRDQADKARELMLESEKLIWVFLYVLKIPEDKADCEGTKNE